MALVLADRVQQTGTANTTVSFTLSGSVTGFQSFAVIGNGNTTYYSAFDPSGNWEVGIGTYATGGTLTRTTIIASSNSGSAVTFSGTVTVFVTQPAENTVVSSNNAGTAGYVLTSNGTGVAPSWQSTSGAVSTTDTFSGNNVTTAFTMSVTPTNSSSTLVVISGVTQPPSSYSVAGTTLTFSTAPPTGTNNISVRYLGVPAASMVNGQYFGTSTVKPIAYNSNTINENIVISYPSMSVGPMTIGSGYTVTVSSGVRWVII